jgi:hypothetical protein
MCTGATFAAWEAFDRVVAFEDVRLHYSSSTSVRTLRACAQGQSIGCGACCARTAGSGSSTSACALMVGSRRSSPWSDLPDDMASQRKRAFDTVLNSYTRKRDGGLFSCAAWRGDLSRSPGGERMSTSMADPRPRLRRLFTPRVIAKCYGSQ